MHYSTSNNANCHCCYSHFYTHEAPFTVPAAIELGLLNTLLGFIYCVLFKQAPVLIHWITLVMQLLQFQSDEILTLAANNNLNSTTC